MTCPGWSHKHEKLGHNESKVIELTLIWPGCHWTCKQVMHRVPGHGWPPDVRTGVLHRPHWVQQPFSPCPRATSVVVRPGTDAERDKTQWKLGQIVSEIWFAIYSGKLQFSPVITVQPWNVLSKGQQRSTILFSIISQLHLKPLESLLVTTSKAIPSVNAFAWQLQVTFSVKTISTKDVKLNYFCTTSANDVEMEARLGDVSKRR